MIEPDRFVDPKTSDVSEEGIERALRPKDLAEYVGQEKTRDQLKIFIDNNFFTRSISGCKTYII